MEQKSKKFYVLKELDTALTVYEMHDYVQFDDLFYDDSYNQVEELGRYENKDEALTALAEHKNIYTIAQELYCVTEYGVQEVELFYDEDGEIDEDKTIYGDWWTAQDDTRYNFEQAKDNADGKYRTAIYRNTRRY